LLIAVLLWLTVCLPVVNDAIQAQQQSKLTTSQSHTAEQRNLPNNQLTNTTEEKSETSINILEEFVSEHHNDFQSMLKDLVKRRNNYPIPLYASFYGDLHLPPPRI